MNNLENIANNIRIDIIEMIYNAKSGHPGGSLSLVEIFTALYHSEMDLSLNELGDRVDKLVLSKGHASPVLYATLSSKGIISKTDLLGYRKSKGILEGHPSNKIPGIDVSSGSLGQGLSIANGMAIAKKLNKDEGYVYVILGDGELEEGQNWEAFMTSSKYNLDNLIIFVDSNGLQIDGTVEEIKKLNNIKEKISSFGINMLECEGNNIDSVINAIRKAKKINGPVCIISKTIKGKGISFMENCVDWHGKSPNEEEYIQAIQELKLK